MDTTIAIDLSAIGQQLQLSLQQVQRTLELLDEGNTVPFITRFRKDQTGGLDEERVRQIREHAQRLRALAERKLTVLKSIESQGRLVPELAEAILHADSAKRLEDLYLPFKPKKQTLATLARQRGLEPLAQAIQRGAAEPLDALAAPYLAADRGLASVNEVLQGVRHLLAEQFSEDIELRERLRRQMFQHGRLVSSRIEASDRALAPTPAAAPTDEREVPPLPAEAVVAPVALPDATGGAEATGDGDTPPAPADESGPAATVTGDSRPAAEPAPASPATSETTIGTHLEVAPATPPPESSARPAPSGQPARPGKPAPPNKKEKKRRKLEAAFKDYYQFREPISRIPPHRVLAINRGERARILRVRCEVDAESLAAAAAKVALAEQHPQHDFLASCLRDALQRLIIPSLERELRRELTEAAEEHAVEVFVRNLRRLLLQPPIRGRRVLAIDPGFRNGCKLVALDEFGNVLDHSIIHVIGRDERRREARGKLTHLIRQYVLSVVAIGNGSGCRETEQLVAEVLGDELRDTAVAYVVVNEAGTSVYSTSPLGREELPDFEPVLRSAISIGRRLLDPLSELVKINPANIGVGLYQHDVKAKHLRESLDAVVESCVNYVGVDVNTASPALLRYVSGLNQLTARRMYEYRREHGPFRSREEFNKVPGIGAATFVQAAGFLRILDGDNPLDATWVHPESYDVARRVLARLGTEIEVLRPLVARTSSAGPGAPAAPPGVAGATAEVGAVPESTASAAVTTPDAAELPSGTPSTAPGETDADARLAARARLAEQAAAISLPELTAELGVGELLLKDILTALTSPGRDPREDLPPPIFRRGIMRLEDLKPGMELTGTILNVVDFGAFVDIGLTESGLVHISQMADRYIRDPHEVVGVGDTLRVWVLEVDKGRRRVSLTAVPPGVERRRAEPKPPAPREAPPRPPPKKLQVKPPPAPPSTSPPPARHERRGRRPRGGQGRTWTAASSLPATPISKEMEEGKEPLRSFSDLLQFYARKNQPPPPAEPQE